MTLSSATTTTGAYLRDYEGRENCFTNRRDVDETTAQIKSDLQSLQGHSTPIHLGGADSLFIEIAISQKQLNEISARQIQYLFGPFAPFMET